MIARLAHLLEQGGWDADSPAGRELQDIIPARVRSPIPDV